MSGDLFKEQRINAKFLVKLGEKGTEVVDMLKEAYGECYEAGNHLQMGEEV